jgi:hypothetical protein
MFEYILFILVVFRPLCRKQLYCISKSSSLRYFLIGKHNPTDPDYNFDRSRPIPRVIPTDPEDDPD